jgi:hypothetical protein
MAIQRTSIEAIKRRHADLEASCDIRSAINARLVRYYAPQAHHGYAAWLYGYAPRHLESPVNAPDAPHPRYYNNPGVPIFNSGRGADVLNFSASVNAGRSVLPSVFIPRIAGVPARRPTSGVGQFSFARARDLPVGLVFADSMRVNSTRRKRSCPNAGWAHGGAMGAIAFEARDSACGCQFEKIVAPGPGGGKLENRAPHASRGEQLRATLSACQQ